MSYGLYKCAGVCVCVWLCVNVYRVHVRVYNVIFWKRWSKRIKGFYPFFISIAVANFTSFQTEWGMVASHKYTNTCTSYIIFYLYIIIKGNELEYSYSYIMYVQYNSSVAYMLLFTILYEFFILHIWFT